METLKSLLNKTSWCAKKRKYNVNTALSNAAKNSAKIEYTVKELIFNYLNQYITKEELENTVRHIYDNNDEVKGVAKQQRAADLLRDLDRYFSSEKRVPIEAPESVLDVWGTEVIVNPDAIFVKDNPSSKHVEVVKYFNKKPDISQSASNLSLYSLLFYAKQVAEMLYPGVNVRVSASFYFLRKYNDKKNPLHPEKDNYDLDFFMTKGGRNIITLSDYNLGDEVDESKRVTMLDTEYHKLFQEFKKGSDKVPTATDCRYCSIYGACSRVKAKQPIPSIPKGSTEVKYTDEQKAVIDFDGGVLRVNAGAGTGKTMTIAGRVVENFKKGMKPEELVLISFTNAAAKEMDDRVIALCEKNAKEITDKVIELCDAEGITIERDKMNIMTFNSLGDMFLRDNAMLLGYAAEPTLIEDSECGEIIEELLLGKEINGLNYTYLRMNEFNVKGGIAVAKEVFRVFKTYEITPKNITQKMDFILGKLEIVQEFINESIIRELYPLFGQYEAVLRERNLIDYVDQELAFKRINEISSEYFEHTGYKELIVDEFQDSNAPQLEIIRILMKSNVFKNLVVVGDDAQSIYGFRDSSPYNIIHLDEILGIEVNDLFLTKNFRSTPQIIDLANKVNDLNTQRIKKTLISCKDSGVGVMVKAYKDTFSEYKDIVSKIKAMITSGKKKPEDIAFIARNKGELENMQELLDAESIDSTILVPEIIKENSRVRAVIGLYTFLTMEGDESGIVTYVNECLDGKWFDITDAERTNYLTEYSTFASSFREASAEEKLEAFTELVNRIPGSKNDEVFASFIDTLGMNHTWSAVSSYLYAFDVYGDSNSVSKKEKYSGVTLTTAHSSKGLEWPVVFASITKFDKEQLHEPNNLAKVEEERRLLFVTITRAKDELYISGKYYSYGTYTTCVSKKNPGTNLNTYLKELYEIYHKGDMVEELKGLSA